MGSMMQFELNLPLDLLTYFSKLKTEQCFEMQAAVNGEALNSCLKLTRAETSMQLTLTGHVADLVELSSRIWRCIISKVSVNDDPVDGSPDSSLIVLPQTNFTKLASLTMMDPEDIKSEDENETASVPLDRASQIRFLSTLPIDSPIKGVMTCTVCQKLFKTLKGIQNHVLKVHNRKWMIYLQDIDDDNLAELISHQGTQAVVTPFKQSDKIRCGECCSVFGNNCLLLKHFEEKHISGVEKRSGMRSRVVLKRLSERKDSTNETKKRKKRNLEGDKNDDSVVSDNDIHPFETDSDTTEVENPGVISAMESLDKEMENQRSSTPVEDIHHKIIPVVQEEENNAGLKTIVESRNPEPAMDDNCSITSSGCSGAAKEAKMRYPCPLCKNTFSSSQYTVFHIKKHHSDVPGVELQFALEEARKSSLKGDVYIECAFCSGTLKGRNLLSHLKRWHLHESTYNDKLKEAYEELKKLGLYHVGDDNEVCVEEETQNVTGEKDLTEVAVPYPARESDSSPPEELVSADQDVQEVVLCEGREESEDEVCHTGVSLFKAIPQNFKCSICEFMSSSKSDFRIHVLQKHMDSITYKEVECQVEDQMVYTSSPDETIMIQCAFCQRRRPGRGMLHHVQVWHKDEVGYEDFLKRICQKLKDMGLHMQNDERNHSKEIRLRRKSYFHYKLNNRAEFLLYVKHRMGESIEENETTEATNVTDRPTTNCAVTTVQKKVKKLKRRKSTNLLKGDYQCSLCEFKTLYHSNMGRHLRTSHASLTMRERCKMMEDMHNPGSRKATKISCEICGKERWGKTILMHMKAWHSKEDQFEVILARTKAALMARNKRHKWMALLQEGICCHCQEKIGTPEEVTKHKKSCSKNKLQKTQKLLCFSCEYKAKSKDDLIAHKLAQHQNMNRSHVCELCGTVYKSLGGLSSHRFVKHNIGNKKNASDWKCDKCEKTFKMKAVFERHLLTHSNVLLAKCDICGKSYKTKGDLNVHYKRIHLNIYPYHCEKCGHGVQRKEWLLRHKCSNVRPRQPRNPLPKSQFLSSQLSLTIPSSSTSQQVLQCAQNHISNSVAQPIPSQTIVTPTPRPSTLPISSISRSIQQIPQNHISKSVTQPVLLQTSQTPNTMPISSMTQPILQMSLPTPQMSIPQSNVFETFMPMQHISPPTLPINFPIMVSVPNATTESNYIQITPLLPALPNPPATSSASQDLIFSPAQPVPLLSTFPPDNEHHEQNSIVVAPNFNGTLQAKDVAWANASWPLSTE